jgi:hypothetical protein
MASIKSADQQVEAQLEKQSSSKFTEVPLEQNGNGKSSKLK